jgi:Rieske Fe-S protein
MGMHDAANKVQVGNAKSIRAKAISRRQFLGGSAGVCGAILLALGLGGATNAATNSRGVKNQAAGITKLKDGKLAVDTKKVKSLGKVGGIAPLGTVNGVPAALVRTGASTYVALDLRCPHAGVTVSQAGSEWRCPAHGSVFKLDGAFVAGPAGGPLLNLVTSRKGNVVTVG